MATFQEKVTALIGNITSTTELNTWLSDGVKDVITKFKYINPYLLKRCATTATIGTSGLALDTAMIVIGAYNETDISTEIDASLRFKAANSNSLYRATTKYPKHYILNNKIYLLPSVEKSYVDYVVTTAVLYTDEAIASFPNEWEHLVVLYAAIQTLQGLVSGLILPDDISLPVIPQIGDFISVSETLPVYSTVSGIVLPASLEEVNIDFSGIGSTPSFTPPNPPVMPSLDLGSDLSIQSLTISAIPPVMGDIDMPEGTIEAFSNPPVFLPPYLNLTSPETLSPLALPVPSVIDFSIDKNLTDAVEIAGIVLPTLALPDVPTLTDADIDSISPPIPPADPSLTTPLIIMPPAPVYGGATKALNVSTAMSTITTQIETNHDIELAAQKINQVSAALQDFTVEIQDALNSFNQQSVKYQAEIQKEIEEARLINSKEKDEYALRLEKFNAEVQIYNAKINAEISKFSANQVQHLVNLWTNRAQVVINEYQAKAGTIIQKYSAEISAKSNFTNSEVSIFGAELQRKAQLNSSNLDRYKTEMDGAIQKWNLYELQGLQAKWIAQRSTEIAKYQADITKAAHEFNEANVIYQADIQKKIQEAANILTSQTEEYRSKLQKFAQEIEIYRTKANYETQEYLQKEINAELTEWTTKRTNSLEEFNRKSINELQRYETELNEKYQNCLADIQIWKGLIEKSLMTYQQETGYDVSKQRLDIESAIARHQEDLKNESERVRNNLEKYVADMRRIEEYNQRVLGKFSQEINGYGLEIQGKIGWFDAILKKRQQSYSWYVDQYVRLSQQYEKGFIPFGGKELSNV